MALLDRMDPSHAGDSQDMRVKNSDSLKILPATLVHCNLNGLFQEDKYINVQI